MQQVISCTHSLLQYDHRLYTWEKCMERLYGINRSNRTGDDLWGKNQFNSTFPASLCAYMRDNSISPVYISTNDRFQTEASDETITFDTVFNTAIATDKIDFLFEANFSPYKSYLHDELDHIDLVISANEEHLRPLEVKLTVLPDNTTATIKDESLWGSELVIRPDSISYACLGIYHSLKSYSAEIREILEPAAIKVENWNTPSDILKHADHLIEALTSFFTQYYAHQQPFLLQPVWKTEGKSSLLSLDAFDVFVWSDFALLKVALDQAKSGLQRDPKKVSRYLRSVSRTIRALNDLFTTGKIHVERIFRGMSLGHQTDKEFAINGTVTNSYMRHPRLKKPILKKSILKSLILDGGEKKLSPERRFDATIYFTASNIFEDDDQ